MNISDVSQKFDIPAETLRYYEKIGLLPSVNRRESGIRDYDQNDLNWVEFIKCMRAAGLPINDLIEYVTLFQQGEKTHDTRKGILIHQKEQLEVKIKEMKQTLSYLKKKIERYESHVLPKERALKKGQKKS